MMMMRSLCVGQGTHQSIQKPEQFRKGAASSPTRPQHMEHTSQTVAMAINPREMPTQALTDLLEEVEFNPPQHLLAPSDCACVNTRICMCEY